MLIRDKLPAYISWDPLPGQPASAWQLDNRARHDAKDAAPRVQGAALLGGLLFCERCGRRMAVHYAGQKTTSWYGCGRGATRLCRNPCVKICRGRCWMTWWPARSWRLSSQQAAWRRGLAAVAEVERERAALLQHWQLRLERAVYETEQAARQYQACRPENRLVGRELERHWEEAAPSSSVNWRRSSDVGSSRRSPGLTAADQEAIWTLASDLPAVWQANTASALRIRKRIARLLLERVTVMVDKDSDKVDVRLHWAGGLTSTHQLTRPVSRYDQQTNYPQLVQRSRENVHSDTVRRR